MEKLVIYSKNQIVTQLLSTYLEEIIFQGNYEIRKSIEKINNINEIQNFNSNKDILYVVNCDSKEKQKLYLEFEGKKTWFLICLLNENDLEEEYKNVTENIIECSNNIELKTIIKIIQKQYIENFGELEIIETLTKREKEILILISRGLLNKEIANELNITERTVKNHISNLFKKINVYDRTQAAVYAIKNKIYLF
ncbi:MAG: response regulator transcription factor [Lachnospiraceae bacterium]|nr:response regulator transcription factor [Lachnospiraceae bacterium]